MKDTGFFKQTNNSKGFIKILLGIIGVLLMINLFTIKGLMSVASNKTILIQVPGILEPGKYMIGGTFASDNVYKMWVKVWVDSIGNFSSENIEKKYEELYPFLDRQTAMESKSEILKFIDFVKKNYISQKFRLNEISIKDLPGGYKRITAYGIIHRKIGLSKDQLSGMKYAYEFITYVKGGSIYIKSINTSFYSINSTKQRRIVNSNKYIDFKNKLK